MSKLQQTLDELLRADRLGLPFLLNGYKSSTGGVKNYQVEIPTKKYLELHLDSLLRVQELMLESTPDAHEVFEPAHLVYESLIRKTLREAHNADREENHKGKGRFGVSLGLPADIGRHILVRYEDSGPGPSEIRLVQVMLSFDSTKVESISSEDSLTEIRRKIDYYSGLGRLRNFHLTENSFESITVIE